tara:strand:+ start:535 stop:972 length:438 start_codon:yes stop_codon:yes gene_type:complete
MKGCSIYKKDNNMKNLFITILLLLSTIGYGQKVLTDDNFEDAVKGRSAFQDDNVKVVVVEFWASFNDANSFEDWDSLKGIRYYRVDISKSPKAKKEYKVRTIPHIILFLDGYDETHFKAGLDFAIKESLEEIQEAIDDLKNQSKF